MKLRVFLAAVGCIYLLAAPRGSLSSSFEGLPVTSIVIQDDNARAWDDIERISSLLLLKAGDTFSAGVVRDTVSLLYLKGLFKDVRVEGFPDDNGVKVIYTLTPITVVETIVITGNKALSRSRILNVISGVEGKELQSDKFPDYRAAIVTLYQSEGHYDALVDFYEEKTAEPHKAVLRIDIREREPTLVAAISFSGNTRFTDKQLQKLMKNRVANPLKSNLLLDTDIAAIVKRYRETGYPAAKAGHVDIKLQQGKAYVSIIVNEGPRVSLRFSGNRAFSDKELRNQLLIWSENDVSDGIIESSAEKICDLYHDQGYSDVKVSVKKTASETATLDLTFTVEEGQRVTVKKIVITGNTHFPEKMIRRQMSLQESGLFGSNPYRESLLDKDMEYIHDRYVDAGFVAANVKKDLKFDAGGKKATVWIEISEGKQTRVGRVVFEGNAVMTQSELQAMLRLNSGDPYNERIVDEDRYRIVSAYSNKGFLYARVDAEKKQLEDRTDIKYKITEDRQVTIGRIVLRGNERTRENVILRELLVKPGDPYDYAKILGSQQRIYRLNYFGQARLEPVRGAEKEYVKDMVLTVEERPAGAVELSLGYGDFDRARGSLEVSYRNLWRSAEYASLRFEESNILKRGSFNYRQPWVFGSRIEGRFGLEWSDSKRLNPDSREIYYQTRKTTTSYGLEKMYERLKASLTYQYENVENYNVLQQAKISSEDEGRVRVSSFTPAVVWDLRDDIFNPHRGTLHGIALKEALTAVGSKADFTKLTVQSSWYIPMRRGKVAAVSGRAGMSWTHRDTSEIPLHERFYMGGSTTVRGFTQDSVGPSQPGTDGRPVPVGGAGMALLNAELRLRAAEGFGFVLFSDAGNVWKEQDIKLDDLRASFGAGIRYGTPIGPLRIDYGQKINRRSGESPGELHFNIGHTF